MACYDNESDANASAWLRQLMAMESRPAGDVDEWSSDGVGRG